MTAPFSPAHIAIALLFGIMSKEGISPKSTMWLQHSIG
jgi:hypothetical protein